MLLAGLHDTFFQQNVLMLMTGYDDITTCVPLVGGTVGLWFVIVVAVVVVVVGGAHVLQHDFLTDGSLQFSLAQPVLLSPNSQSETFSFRGNLFIKVDKHVKVPFMSLYVHDTSA